MSTTERLDSNYLEAYRLLTRLSDDGETAELDGISITSCSSTVAGFNSAFSFRPPPHPAFAIRSAAAFFVERNLRWTLRLGWEPDAAVLAAIDGVDLGPPENDPGMTLEPIPAPSPLPGELTIVEERDIDGWERWLATACEGFEIPLEAGRRLFPPSIIGDHSAIFTGYAGGAAAVTSCAVLNADTVGVYSVATTPTHRRRGFGAALTEAAAAWGAERGATMAILQSSQMGYPVYRRLGYEEVRHYLLFSSRTGEERQDEPPGG